MLNLFQVLVNSHPELFLQNDQPITYRKVKVWGLNQHLRDVAEIESERDGKQEPLKSVMGYIYENQINGVYNMVPRSEIKGVQKKIDDNVSVFKTYNDLDTSWKQYFKKSIKLLTEWEKDPQVLLNNLVRLRNQKF